MADISKINIGGQDYNIKDASARNDIASIQAAIKGGIHFAGKVSQEVADGAEVSKTTLTLTAAETPGGTHVATFHTGDIIIDAKNREFINDGTYWRELGRGDEFGSFAFVNAGSVTTSNHTHNYKRTSLTHTVSGTVTSTGTIVPQGGLTIDTTNTNSNFQPEGTIDKPNVDITAPTTSFVTGYAGSFGKLTTTTLTPVNGTDIVHDTPTLNKKKLQTTTIKIKEVSGTDTVHDTPTMTYNKLTTATLRSVDSTGTVHDTPTMTYNKLTTATLKQVNSITSKTASKLSSNNLSYCTVEGETLKITAVTASDVSCSLVTSSDVTYATGALSAADAVGNVGGSVGTGLSEGSAMTFATIGATITYATGALSSADAVGNVGGLVGTGLSEGSAMTFATANSSDTSITYATGALVDSDTNGGSVGISLTDGTPMTFAKAGAAVTYATGAITSVSQSDTDTVMVGLGTKSASNAVTSVTAALAANPTFTGAKYKFSWSGSNTSVTVTGNADQVKIDDHTETETNTTSNGGETLTVSPVDKVQ